MYIVLGVKNHTYCLVTSIKPVRKFRGNCATYFLSVNVDLIMGFLLGVGIHYCAESVLQDDLCMWGVELSDIKTFWKFDCLTRLIPKLNDEVHLRSNQGMVCPALCTMQGTDVTNTLHVIVLDNHVVQQVQLLRSWMYPYGYTCWK